MIAPRILHLRCHTSPPLSFIVLATVASEATLGIFFRFLKVKKFTLISQLLASTQLFASLVNGVVFFFLFSPSWNQYHCCLCFTVQPACSNFKNISTVLLKGPFFHVFCVMFFSIKLNLIAFSASFILRAPADGNVSCVTIIFGLHKHILPGFHSFWPVLTLCKVCACAWESSGLSRVQLGSHLKLRHDPQQTWLQDKQSQKMDGWMNVWITQAI